MSLANPSAFFDALRAGLLGPALSADEVDGCNAILKAMEGSPLAYTAYALATAYHETASTWRESWLPGTLRISAVSTRPSM
jgi:putative chitinase